MAPRAERAVPGSGRGLSTRGRCLLAGGVAAIICAVILDERDLVAIGAVAVLLPTLAVLFTGLRRSQLRVEHRVLPERIQPGTRAAVLLGLTNTSRHRTHTLDLTQPEVPGLIPGSRTVVPPLAGRSGTDLTLPFVATRRGRFRIGSAVLRVHDPFDLWEDHRELPGTAEVLVVPTLIPLTDLPRGSGTRSAASGRAVLGSVGGDPDVGVRPYRSGDDIRTVHWRASARLEDDLVVRLEEPVSHGGAALLLDHRVGTHPGEGPSGSLELAVTLAASIGLHLVEQDTELTLTDHTGTVLLTGHDIVDDLLTHLAEVEPDPVGAFHPVVPHRAGVLVAIVGDLTEEEARRLAALRHRSVNAIAFVVRTTDWTRPGEGPFTPPTALVLQHAGWRVVPVGRGDDLAAAWRQACGSRTTSHSGAPVGVR